MDPTRIAAMLLVAVLVAGCTQTTVAEYNAEPPELSDAENAADGDDFWRFRLVQTETIEWPHQLTFADCGTGSHSWLPFGSSWYSSHLLDGGDVCEFFFGGETENPLYDGSPLVSCLLSAESAPILTRGRADPPCERYDPTPDWDPPSLTSFTVARTCPSRLLAVTADGRFALSFGKKNVAEAEVGSTGVSAWFASLIEGQKLSQGWCPLAEREADSDSVAFRSLNIESGSMEITKLTLDPEGSVASMSIRASDLTAVHETLLHRDHVLEFNGTLEISTRG